MPLPAACELATWQQDRRTRVIRRTVFIEEQRIPERDEWDDIDPSHARARLFEHGPLPQNVTQSARGASNPPVRLVASQYCRSFRGTGLASRSCVALMELAAERGFTEVYLNAQVAAAGILRAAGFPGRRPGIRRGRNTAPVHAPGVGKRDGQRGWTLTGTRSILVESR
jgi:hypothetical protein